MSKLFYYLMTEGVYDDYKVEGIYFTDHSISQREWEECALKYDRELSGQRALLPTSGPEDFEKAYAVLKAWEMDNNPYSTFRKLHNMQKIDYTELTYD